MTNSWSTAARRRERLSAFDAEADAPDGPIPGLPHGARALAPLSALGAGALAGVVLGVSGGPVAARVGAGVGACVGLLIYLGVRSRRRQAPAEGETEDDSGGASEPTSAGFARNPPSLAAHPLAARLAARPIASHPRWRAFARWLAQVVGYLSLLTGGAAAIVTYCLMDDDRTSDQVILGMGVFTVALLATASKMLWLPAHAHRRTP